jgi:hypothetical protein
MCASPHAWAPCENCVRQPFPINTIDLDTCLFERFDSSCQRCVADVRESSQATHELAMANPCPYGPPLHHERGGFQEMLCEARRRPL